MMWNRSRRWLHRRSDADFSAEIESHLAMEADRLARSGMTEDDARFAAARAFGNATVARERFHEARAGAIVESLTQDIRLGLRTMRRTPVFTAVAVASMAIGIGANTTMFSALDALLFRAPSHVRDADLLHRVHFQGPNPDGSTWTSTNQSYRLLQDIRSGAQGIDGAAAFSPISTSSGRGADARPVDLVVATPNFFPMLGVRPALGRFFVESEERDEGDHVAVLSYEMWRARFGGDSLVLGRNVDVAGMPYVIVGVAPEGFTGVDPDRVDLWLPLGAATRLYSPRALNPTGGSYWLQILVKRRTAGAVAQVASSITALYRDANRDYPRFEETIGKSNAVVGPIVAARGPTSNADARVSVWVAAVSALVLLIASANVANLLLLRGLARSREVALRLSLGASRWRIARQWLVEGLLLAAVGAMCALVIAHWSASAMRAFLLPKAASQGIVDPRLLAFTAVVALGAGVLASIVPALLAARRNFGSLLGGDRATEGPQRLMLQRVLIGGQVALATVLLVGAGLFVTSLRNVQAIDLGVDADRLLYVKLNLAGSQAGRDRGTVASTNATHQLLLEQVRRVPGVAHATLTSGEPLTSGWGISLKERGAPNPAPGTRSPMGRAVGTDYFATMGTSLIRGRLFTAADHRPNARVAIIDEVAAKELLPNGNGLEACVELGSEHECTEIVGVVENSMLWQMVGDRTPIVYVPLESWPSQAVTMMEVRTNGDVRAIIPALRQAVLAAKPDLPWVDIRSVGERLSPQLKPWRLGASMFTAFGVLAIALAAVGLYGLLSYQVAQRAREIGIRKALGALDGSVVRMVLRGALGLTVAGAMIGVVIALAGGRLVASQLYGVSPKDPMVLAFCASILVAVGVLAAFAPALRATRVDPMAALRSE